MKNKILYVVLTLALGLSVEAVIKKDQSLLNEGMSYIYNIKEEPSQQNITIQEKSSKPPEIKEDTQTWWYAIKAFFGFETQAKRDEYNKIRDQKSK